MDGRYLVTTQENLMWHEKRETKIGDYGEKLVTDFLRERNCVFYRPDVESSSPHLCDGFITKNFKLLTAADIKTKPRRKKFPDTGIDYRHYIRYKQITEENNINFYLFFVDDVCKAIYGNYLRVLDNPCISNGIAYPIEELTKYGNIIRYYPLSVMQVIRKLTNDEISELKRLRGDNL